MNKGHKIVADYLTNYIHYNNLDKLTEVLSKGKTFRRGEKYLFNIEKQIEEIKSDVYTAVWYLMEFLQQYEEDIFYKDLYVGRFNFNEDDEFVILKIDNQFIKIIYSCEISDIRLVNNENTSFGKIDLNWFEEQIKTNFHSNVAEVLQDIKNNIKPLETTSNWIEIESTL